MDTGVKELLARNTALLTRNLIQTEEFWSGLQAEKVIPASMIQDAKQTKGNRQERNRKLVEVISVRAGADTVGRLCDVLLATGHTLLGEALRDDLSSLKAGGNSDAQQPTETSELLRKFPKVISALSEREKSDFTRALADKVRQMALREVWRRVESRDDKLQLVDARRRQLEEAWRHRDQLQRLEGEVARLRTALEAEAREADSRRREAKELQSHVDYLKQSHQRELDTQVKFNVANDKSLLKLEEVGDETERTVVEVVGELHTALEQKTSGDTGKGASQSTEGGFDFQKALFESLTPSDKLRSVCEKVVLALSELKHLQEDYNGLFDERLYVLSHLGASDTANLRQSFCDYVVGREEQITELRDSLAVLELAAQEAEANDEMDQLRKDLVLKDNRISLLEQQLASALAALKNANNQKQGKFVTLGSAKTINRRPATPHFKHFENSSATGSVCSSPQHQDMTDQTTSIMGAYKTTGQLYVSENDVEANQSPAQWSAANSTADPRKERTIFPSVLAKRGGNAVVPYCSTTNPYQAHSRVYKPGSPTKPQHTVSHDSHPRLTQRQRHIPNIGRPKALGHSVPDPLMRSTTTIALPKPVGMDPLFIAQIRR